MIHLRILGQIELSADDGGDAGALIAQPKRFALLCYLAIPKPGTMFRRDTLLGVFWPEGDTEHSRTALRQALAHVRRTLGDDIIVRRGSEEVGLNPDLFWCDVGAFEQALDVCNWADAIDLYRGELLKGFYLNNGPEFERWLDGERSRLSGRYAKALEELANAATAAGKTRAAIEWWQALALHDPYDSRYAISLMEALDRAGDPGNALLHAKNHVQLLREELEIGPPAEFEETVERMRKYHGTSLDIEVKTSRNFEDRSATHDSDSGPAIEAYRARKSAKRVEPDSVEVIASSLDGSSKTRERIRRTTGRLAIVILATVIVAAVGLAYRGWTAGSTEHGVTDISSPSFGASTLLELTAAECVDAVEQTFYSRASRERAHIPDLLDRALRLEPDLARAHAFNSIWLTNRAMEAPEVQARDSALVEAERAIALDSTCWTGHMALGYARWYTQDRIGQLQPLIKAVELAPDARGPRRALWWFYANTGQVHLGRGWQVLETSPSGNEHTRPLTAWLQCTLGDYEEAEHSALTAIAVNPLPAAHELLAKILLSQGKVAEARTQIEHALDIEGQHHKLRRRQLALAGLVDLAAGNHKQAHLRFEAALDIDPSTAVVPQNYLVTTTGLGFALLKQGDDRRARQMLQRSMELDREALAQGHTYVALHQYDLARVHAILGNVTEANRWLKEALRHGWYYAYTYMGPRDPLLENLRGSTEFEQMMDDVRAELDRQRAWITNMDTLSPDELFSMLMNEAYSELALLTGETPAAMSVEEESTATMAQIGTLHEATASSAPNTP